MAGRRRIRLVCSVGFSVATGSRKRDGEGRTKGELHVTGPQQWMGVEMAAQFASHLVSSARVESGRSVESGWHSCQQPMMPLEMWCV